jgi:hypothetical protein
MSEYKFLHEDFITELKINLQNNHSESVHIASLDKNCHPNCDREVPHVFSIFVGYTKDFMGPFPPPPHR